ncbi:hypothetical protein ACFQZ4_41065 [Catellatospora coxensis]|uniref:Uncharacterized protein n=1 Tax=Catellatospora coxensis TaxID=310354 RepID=A0A8J3P5R9_9ACTN|nr:hypothetical protein [Catellatospora coxensis]GIG04744.1 hypothetical protein Cco03nite_14440 [Catellatospora coxensis]
MIPDRHVLVTALLETGQPPESFQVPGVHEHVPIPTDFWFLRPAGERWEIGSYERGVYDVREILDTEAAACTRFYEVLTGFPDE